MNDHVGTHDGARDFDFWMGRWKARNRRLVKRLAGSTEWAEFDATCVARPLLDRLGNEDEYRTEYWSGFIGMSFRFFDPLTQKWAIYWADSRRGTLEPPVFGSFSGGTGVFEGTDTFEGRPIRVRFIWSRVDTETPRWEQAFSADDGQTWETNWIMDMTRDKSTAFTSEEFPVIELRRYEVQDGEREHFGQYFDSYFPETFQHMGVAIFGQFLERRNASGFTFLRGFKSMEERARTCHEFYDGPLWHERAETMNQRLLTFDNVLLLRPLSPSQGLRTDRMIDFVNETQGPRGIVVAQIFTVHARHVEALAQRAQAAFASYRDAGAREVGLLATLDVPNNFPRHPVRIDGPFLVWLGVVEDERMLAGVAPLADAAALSLTDSGLLRGETEWVVMDPTSRSRLRWRKEAQG
jgi:NIPSNAP